MKKLNTLVVAFGAAILFASTAMPAGVDGGLVTVCNAVISLLIAAGLIKNTNGEDLTAKQIAKEKEQAEALLNSLGISQEELKALAKVQMPEIKEEPKNEA